MKFDAKASTGKAGEYYFAYWITRNFNWPCRLLDIDVGIDAQIEIFDDNNHSTGDFIGAQIKTTESEDPNVSIKLNNMMYWKTIEDPVILVSITTSSEVPEIYWKEINNKNVNKHIEQAKKNKSKTTTVKFSSRDLISIDDRNSLAKLPYARYIKIAEASIGESTSCCNEINESFWSQYNENYSWDNVEDFDYMSIDFYIERFECACIERDKVNEIIKIKPKIEQLASGIYEMEQAFGLASSNIYNLIDAVSEFDGDHGFERSKAWMKSETHKTIVRMFEDTHQNM